MISVDQIPVVRMEDRLGFRYVEKASIYVKDNTIVMSRKNGRKEHLCPSSVSCVLLGAGTSVSRDAVKLFSDSYTTLLWCGRRGMSMYTVGLNANSSMTNAKTQIDRIMNHRLSLWKKLLAQREISYRDTDNWKELLLVEAAYMKRQYETTAEQYGLHWNGRVPQVSKMDPDDKMNYAMTICNMALYGIATSCISGMGYLPQFGVIHGSGATPLSYDIADVVKTHTSIPVSMEYVAKHAEVDVNELLSIFSRHISKENISGKFAHIITELFQKNL